MISICFTNWQSPVLEVVGLVVVLGIGFGFGFTGEKFGDRVSSPGSELELVDLSVDGK